MISEDMLGQISQTGGIRDAYNEAQRQYPIYGRENVFDFSIGNPAAPPPKKVDEAIRMLLDKGISHGYMADAGYEDVRTRIADHLNKKYGTDYTVNEVIMTTGVAGGINSVLCSVINPGDEVLTFRPFYPGYTGFTENWKGKLVTVDPKGEDFFPDYEDLDRKINERTKVVIINSPHNPTGTIYTKEVAEKLCAVLKKKEKEIGHEIYLLSDEPYRELVYDGTELPWWPDYYDDTIVSYSFSKSLSLAGERIGYLVIPKKVADSERLTMAVRRSIGKIGYVNAPALFQRVAAECLDESVDLSYYAKNRDVLYNALLKCGFTAVYPRGAFYIFVKCPCDEIEFIEKAKERHLMLVGGRFFGYEGYVRLSFCGDHDMLVRSVPALELLAKDYGLM